MAHPASRRWARWSEGRREPLALLAGRGGAGAGTGCGHPSGRRRGVHPGCRRRASAARLCPARAERLPARARAPRRAGHVLGAPGARRPRARAGPLRRILPSTTGARRPAEPGAPRATGQDGSGACAGPTAPSRPSPRAPTAPGRSRLTAPEAAARADIDRARGRAALRDFSTHRLFRRNDRPGAEPETEAGGSGGAARRVGGQGEPEGCVGGWTPDRIDAPPTGNRPCRRARLSTP